MASSISLQEIEQAGSILSGFIRRTSLIRCAPLEYIVGAKVFLKCENQQITGSFKVRGALYAVSRLSISQRHLGVVARSSGNFAIGVSHACTTLGVPATVFMPTCTPKTKILATKNREVEVVLYGSLLNDSIPQQSAIAKETGRHILSSYDDFDVIAGQGTVALEVSKQLADIQHFYAPIGGGGLLSGCALALKAQLPYTRIVGVEPSGAARFALSRAAGCQITLEKLNTIADGLRVEALGKRNWPLLQKYVDDVAAVSDEDIIRAMILLKTEMGLMVEPSGAVSVAALLNGPRLKGNVVCVITGGNISYADFLRQTAR